MFRSISRRLSSRDGRKKPQESTPKTNANIENRVVTYADPITNDQKEPLNPHTRKMQLFQVKTNNADNNGKEMDRTLYEMPMPDTSDAMTDLIKIHKDGDKFPYVGIVGSSGETGDARRARMLSLKPSLGLRNIPEVEVVGCPLINTEGEFSMSSLMDYAQTLSKETKTTSGPMPSTNGKKDYKISKPYIHIKSVTGLYTPNMSSTADYCNLWFSLLDTRLVNQNKSGQSNILVSNQEAVVEMSCDYCVSYNDLSSFVLGYTLEREILLPGFQWGTISFYFNITESDIPYQSTKRDALAVYRMPISTLTDRLTSADISNISFTPADLVKMRGLYQQGDIVDVDEPQKSRLKKSSYSKSTMRGAIKGEKIDSGDREGWGFMKGAVKPLIDANEASVDEFEDDDGSEEINVAQITKDEYEARQELLRQEARKAMLKQINEGADKEIHASVESDDEDPEIFKKMMKSRETKKNKAVGFQVQDV